MVLIEQSEQTARNGWDQAETLLWIAFPAQNLGSSVDDHLALDRCTDHGGRHQEANITESSAGAQSHIVGVVEDVLSWSCFRDGSTGGEQGGGGGSGADYSHGNAVSGEGFDGHFGRPDLIGRSPGTGLPRLPRVARIRENSCDLQAQLQAFGGQVAGGAGPDSGAPGSAVDLHQHAQRSVCSAGGV